MLFSASLWVIACQVNQKSPAIFDFWWKRYINEEDNMLNVMYEYLLSNPIFVNGGQNYNFYLRFGAKLQGGKNDFRKMAAS